MGKVTSIIVAVIAVAVLMLIGQEAESGEGLLKLLLGVGGLVFLFCSVAAVVSAGASVAPRRRHYHERDEE